MPGRASPGSTKGRRQLYCSNAMQCNAMLYSTPHYIMLCVYMRVFMQNDLDEFVIESTLFPSFDALVRRLLEPIWHRISTRSRLLIHDFATLRQIIT